MYKFEIETEDLGEIALAVNSKEYYGALYSIVFNLEARLSFQGIALPDKFKEEVKEILAESGLSRESFVY